MPSRPWSVDTLEERRQASRRLSDMPLVWIALTVGLGVVLEQTIWPRGLSVAWLLPTTLVLFVCWYSVWRKLKNQTAALLLLCGILCLATYWSGFSWRLFPPHEIGRYAPHDAEPVCLEGIVLSAPVTYRAEPRTPFHAIPPSDRSVIQLEVTRLRNGTKWQTASGRCEVRLDAKLATNGKSATNDQPLEAGKHVRLFGQLRQPSAAMNPGQHDAARKGRANRRMAIVWCESLACVTPVSSDERTSSGIATMLTNSLQRCRRLANDCLTQHLSAENAPLASAMLLGDASNLPRTTSDAFRTTGTMHVLVVSGLHVGLVASLPLLLGLIGVLPMRVAQGLSLLLVVGYVGLVGARPPALRAAILVGGTVVAAFANRQPLGINSLAGAAITLFITSPGAFESVGTKLSFLAAATLLGVGAVVSARQKRPQSPLERLIDRSRSFSSHSFKKTMRWSGLLLLATVAVLITTGPLIAAEFHLVSPAALLLALPVMTSVMVIVPSGLLLVATEFIGSGLPDTWLNALTWLPAQVCDHSIGFLRECVSHTANVSFSSFYTPGPATWWVNLWYPFLGISALLLTYWPNRRGIPLRLGLALLAVAFVPTLKSYFAEPQLRVSAIAVGHGLSMLIETPDGQAILYDAGALGSPGRATEIISRVLWSRGITELDAVVLSHADVDHYNAMPGLIERFTIHQVWTSRVMFDSWEEDNYESNHVSGPELLQQMLAEHGIPVHELAMGQILYVGEESADGKSQRVKIEVLHPTQIGVPGSDNANSVVLGIEYLGKRLLLTGDLESPGLEQVLASEPYPCELLIAPHHGSIRSEPAGLIQWCSPKRVLISSGDEHPQTEAAYSQSGAELLGTHEVGMITTVIDSTGVHWSGLKTNE